TGTRPFNGSNTRQRLMQHINGTPDLSALPPADKPIVAQALAKRPDDRWPSCSEMIRALRQTGTGSGTFAPPPAVPAAPPDSAAATRPQGRGPPHAEGPPRPGGRAPAGVKAQPRGPVLPRRPPGSKPGSGVVASPPLPPLVTAGPAGTLVPRLVTPSAAGANNPGVTLQRPSVVQTGRMAS